MKQDTCLSIKDLLLGYLSEFTTVTQDGDECIITVPLNTLDNRWVDVVIVEKSKDYFLVHDAGKSADELFLQGMTRSEGRLAILKKIAARNGVDLVSDAVFTAHCPKDLLQHSIWAVAQSSSLAMTEILRHKSNGEEDSSNHAVGQIIREWSGEHSVRFEKGPEVRGKIAQHSFDFMASDARSVVAINVLNPASAPLSRAERYGYQALDLVGSSADSWKKMVVLAKPEVWTPEAKRIVKELADNTVEFWSLDASKSNIIASLRGLMAA